MISPCIVVDHRRDDFANHGGRNNLRGYIESPVEKYFDLPLPEDNILATYIWIDSTGENLRYKDKILKLIPKTQDKFAKAVENVHTKLKEESFKNMTCSQSDKHLVPCMYNMTKKLDKMYKIDCHFQSVERNRDYFDESSKELPIVSFDGGASQLAIASNSDMYLCPRAIYRNPFRHGNHILVMCDTYDMHREPTETNHRLKCAETHRKCRENEPWFDVDQKFFILNPSPPYPWPLGWPKGGFPLRGDHYFCGVGADKIFCRDLIETHYRCCLFAGVQLNGISAEVGPSQWEYRVGPSVGVDAGDNCWISRFILSLLAEQYGVAVSFDPKPVENWEGSSAYTSFSTKEMRGENCIKEIENAIYKLESVHTEHLRVYDPHGGKDIERRFRDSYEKENCTEFSFGIAKRFCSINIPLQVARKKKGYLVDRRPASNCDPYQIVNALMRTCILND